MAGMPYPPTSVRIRAHLWEVLLCQKFPCVPCVLWEFLFSHGFHRFTQILRVRCSPTEFTEFGSVGMAGMPYPPTSVRICAICGRLFSARSFCEFRAFCGNIFSPTDFTDLHRYLGCAVLPQNSQNPQNLSAWVWQGCHTLLICAHPCHLWEFFLCKRFCVFGAFRGSFFTACSVGAAETAAPLGWQRGYGRDAIPSYICAHPCHLWESFLCKRFCVFGAFRGSFFTACSVGAAETAAPPGGIHGSSVQISPPHHLTTSPSISPRTQPSACPPSTVGTTSSPLAAR